MSELLVIVGPTASGKSALAGELAPELVAEIVTADSRQVYRGMDVGTAKPSHADRERVPQHLLDLVEPNEVYDVSRYQRDADAVLSVLERRERVAIVVGGTGLYVRAVVDGLALADLPHDAALRGALEEEARRSGPERLHARLAERDPEAARRVHPRNVRRVVRYLEVTELVGPITARWSKRPARAARMVGLRPPLDELDRRIDTRVREMVERGVIEETRGLLARYGSLSRTAMTAHGYPHWIAHLEGTLSLDEAIRRTQRDTRAYSRRQLTWFRRDARVQWFDSTPRADAVRDAIATSRSIDP
ncbi:MAG: tRNA (adenosine(37)-N6)-dimethylallyltransferase MiaA [Chloroflexi bacterium 13_1_40CM_4_68_4]|nr:MAG: tRNA (adenosine(37)-N6)-dimethylallyltransferase MiaA [Chloroflexi bacterium 13_1_40CM_4_68_4]